MDGTLVDSMPTWNEKIVEFVRSTGVSFPEDILRITTPMGRNQTAKYLISLGIQATVPEILDQLRKLMIAEYENTLPLKAGAKEYLLEKKREKAKLALLTASPHFFIDPCLKRNGIWDLFDFVWSVEDLQNLSKKEPEIYRVAAAQLGCDVKEATFFDDNKEALQGAVASGIRTVGVFDHSSAQDEPFIRSVTDRYIYSFEELLNKGVN